MTYCSGPTCLAGHAGHGGLQGRLYPRQGRCGDPALGVLAAARGPGGGAGHSRVSLGPDDIRLPQDGSSAAVPPGDLYVPLQKTRSSEVSLEFNFKFG